MSQVTQKIITRGMGMATNGNPGQCSMVAQGFSGPPSAVIAAIERPLRLRLGQSGTKRYLASLDEVVVWAKLIEINGKAPEKPIKGWVRARVEKNRGFASVMAESVRVVRDFIKVTVERLK